MSDVRCQESFVRLLNFLLMSLSLNMFETLYAEREKSFWLQNSISNVPTIATSWRARALGHRWCSSFPKGSSATFAFRGVTLFRGKKNFQRII